MPILGAHQSIAGGYYRSVEIAQQMTCECVQLFTKNNNQWRAKELTDSDVTRFRDSLAEHGILHPLAHNSYLINLAAPDDELWKKSIDAMVIEVQRAERLGLIGVVAHPGAFTTSSEAQGLKRIAAALDEVHAQTRGAKTQILLETTAGQGSCLGHRFEHLAEIIGTVQDPDRLGVCVDTCHVFAAGYPLASEAEYQQTMAELERNLGTDRVKAFHLNDSKPGLGSRVDRHAHIGRGKIGISAFAQLLNDPRWQQTPMYLETPKEKEEGVEMDVVNLTVLRKLVKK